MMTNTNNVYENQFLPMKKTTDKRVQPLLNQAFARKERYNYQLDGLLIDSISFVNEVCSREDLSNFVENALKDGYIKLLDAKNGEFQERPYKKSDFTNCPEWRRFEIAFCVLCSVLMKESYKHITIGLTGESGDYGMDVVFLHDDLLLGIVDVKCSEVSDNRYTRGSNGLYKVAHDCQEGKVVRHGKGIGSKTYEDNFRITSLKKFITNTISYIAYGCTLDEMFEMQEFVENTLYKMLWKK